MAEQGKRYVGLASYRVSDSFARLAVDALGGELETLDVASLRRLPARQLLRTLRSHRGRPFALLFEDEASTALIPVLTVLAVVAGADTITVVRDDGTTTRVRKRSAIGSALAVALVTLSARRAARRAAAETAELCTAPRDVRRLPESNRVLYVNANLWFGLKAGGSVGHVAGVVNALLDEGMEVDVAAVGPQPLVRERARFVRLDPPHAFGLPPELNQYRFSQSAEAQLRPDTTRGRYRFVYQRLSLGNYTGARIAHASGLPLVLEYNGSEVWVARHWGRPLADEALARAAEDASLRQADVVVTVSDVLGDELAARGVDPARVVVHPNGVDPAMFDPRALSDEGARAREELGIPPDAIVVTFLGTFGKWHGTDVLARAIGGLVSSDAAWVDQRDVHFLLVGDGLQMPYVREVLGGRGSGRVHLTGLVPQSRAPRYLAASDVVVSPHVPNEDGSPFFGSPTKLFEYMAMGLPIVASELDQIGEVLQPSLRVAELAADAPVPDDAVALLATPRSEQELADGIRRLVDRPQWRSVLGENARRLALERYTWDAHVTAILARLDELCG
ncbi:MAG: glycosyltransferase family 4 protein [Gaiellaceae bacterium]